MMCTLPEIADAFSCSPDTIERWCKRTYKKSFADVFKEFSQGGKRSLRRMQFHLAERNASMAIFLGRQYLGQSDNPAADGDAESLQMIGRLGSLLEKARKTYDAQVASSCASEGLGAAPQDGLPPSGLGEPPVPKKKTTRRKAKSTGDDAE